MIAAVFYASSLFMLGQSSIFPTMHRPPSNDRVVSKTADEARQTMRIYTTCLVKRSQAGKPRERLVRFLATPSGAPNSRDAATAVTTPDCLSAAGSATTYVSQLSFQPTLLRGEVFRALYLQGAGDRPGQAIGAGELMAGWAGADDDAAPMRDFGNCVVAQDAANADAAIRGKVSSEAETAAYRALAPAMARCVTGGSRLTFSRAVLEAVLSEALYRRAVGAIPAAVVTGAK